MLDKISISDETFTEDRLLNLATNQGYLRRLRDISFSNCTFQKKDLDKFEFINCEFVNCKMEEEPTGKESIDRAGLIMDEFYTQAEVYRNTFGNKSKKSKNKLNDQAYVGRCPVCNKEVTSMQTLLCSDKCANIFNKQNGKL